MSDYLQNREKAMLWWDSLSALSQTQLCDIHPQLVGQIRRRETLTGREIELLYNCKCELHTCITDKN